jgi:hypothetical protein
LLLPLETLYRLLSAGAPDSLIESRLEGGGEWVESEIYKLKYTLQVGVSVRIKSEPEREGENKSTKK